MTLHNITLKETVTKNMVIEAETLEDAEVIALNHHFGWSDKADNARIRELSTTIEGSVLETREKLSYGSIRRPAKD